MHFIIENVTGEHLQRCHNLITVCKYDTAVGRILNTNGEEDFSCHLCTLSVNVPAGEIAVSTTICFYIILRGYFTQEMWATCRGGRTLRGFIHVMWSLTSGLFFKWIIRFRNGKYHGMKHAKRRFPWQWWLWSPVKQKVAFVDFWNIFYKELEERHVQWWQRASEWSLPFC